MVRMTESVKMPKIHWDLPEPEQKRQSSTYVEHRSSVQKEQGFYSQVRPMFVLFVVPF